MAEAAPFAAPSLVIDDPPTQSGRVGAQALSDRLQPELVEASHPNSNGGNSRPSRR